MGLRKGSKVDRFTIVRPIASGGMGSVFEAHDPRLNRQIALKVLHPPVVEDEHRVQRFMREARAACAVRHPNIPILHDAGESDGLCWLAMELVGGESLADRLAHAQVSIFDAVNIIEQAASALDAMHAADIVHRDVKCANIMLVQGGGVRLVDFGLAKSRNDVTITSKNLVAGTAGYLAPERCRGEAGGPRSDIYSLACVAWEMMNGRRVFTGEANHHLMWAHEHSPVPRLPLSLGEFQPAFDRGLAKLPAQRHATAGAFASALRTAMPRDVAATSGHAVVDEEVAFEWMIAFKHGVRMGAGEFIRFAHGLVLHRFGLWSYAETPNRMSVQANVHSSINASAALLSEAFAGFGPAIQQIAQHGPQQRTFCSIRSPILGRGARVDKRCTSRREE